jgi:hypothetical protein
MEKESTIERFERIGIVCIGMGTAEDVEPAAGPVTVRWSEEFLTSADMLDEEDRVREAQEQMAAGDHEPGAEEAKPAMESENPEPIATQQIVAEEPKKLVYDWYMELDGGVSKILERDTSDAADHGRNYRRDAAGKLSEDRGLERRGTHNGPGAILWVVPNGGSKPFPSKVGTRLIHYCY